MSSNPVPTLVAGSGAMNRRQDIRWRAIAGDLEELPLPYRFEV